MSTTETGRAKRAALHTLGCRLNQSETQLLRDKLVAAGYEVVPFGMQADLGIINTCTVTREADAKSRKAVRKFIRQNPDAFTAVIGCYGQTGHASLSEVKGVDLVVGTEEKLNVLHYASSGKPANTIVIRDGIGRDDFTIEAQPATTALHRPNLKVQDGCDFMCSFCIIPFARGRARSRVMDDLLAEARMRVDEGARELVLTGVNIGTYDWGGNSVVDIVDGLAAIAGLDRIRISSIEPTTVPEGILRQMAEPNHPLVPHLHLPLQAGSNEVLARMKRKYTREEYADFVRHAQSMVPDLCVGTDVMVGMPGETEADFAETCGLISDLSLAYAHVFKFSERPGTAAQRMDGHVEPGEKDSRGARLRRLSAECQTKYMERFLGREVLVLFEETHDGVWTGYTPHYMRVAVESGRELSNELVPVRMDRIAGDHMIGTLADVG